MLVGTGSNETRFTVHHEIITKRSAFFRKARSERWTTDKSKPADLHEHKPETFEVYLYCLYHDAAPEAPLFTPIPWPKNPKDKVIFEKYEEQVSITRQAFSESRFNELVDLYILADVLADPTTANIAIDEIRRFTNSFHEDPSAGVITYAFRFTRDGDGLRMLLADNFLYGSSKISPDDLPKECFYVVGERFLEAKEYENIVVKDNMAPGFFREVKGSLYWDGDEYDYYQDVEEDEE